MRNGRLVTIFGGSGFIGRYAARSLALQGWRVRVACRRPDLAYFLQPLGGPGQIHSVQANVRDPQSVQRALRDSDAVVNLVGVLDQAGPQNHANANAKAAENIAHAAASAGVSNFVHVSVLGADSDSPCSYYKSKGTGDKAALAALPEAVVLRPSIVFGPEDQFLNRFAAMARFSYVVPIIGAATRFQPVFVGDVAQAVAAALSGRARPGQIYELGGPEAATGRTIVNWVCRQTGRRRLVVSVSPGIGRVLGWMSETTTALTLGLYPDLLRVTRDQVSVAQYDNVVSNTAKSAGLTLEGLGVAPESFRAIAPTYLYRYRAAGQYQLRGHSS